MVETFKREMKYIVLKRDDIDRCLSPQTKTDLHNICLTLEMYRINTGKKQNAYVVVNEDEPYAEKVWKLIEDYWWKSKHDLTYHQREILSYLKGKGCFVSPTEIGNNVGGFSLGGLKRSSAWSCRILKRLVAKELVVKNEKGFYRYKA